MHQLLQVPVDQLTYDQLDSLVRHLNTSYREGTPLVSDDSFDQIYMQALSQQNPDHEFFTKPQPEPISSKGRVHHGENPMLSTQKAYDLSEIESWVKRCRNAATEIGTDPDSLVFRLTPKLDGIACKVEPTPMRLLTRGDGEYGFIASHLLEHGLVIKGNYDVESVGEVIIDESYYQNNLTEISPHPRNFVSGMVSADNLNEHALAALKNGAVHLVLYKDIDAEHVDSQTLIETLDQLVLKIHNESKYRLDGVVIEITNEDVKRQMQSTSHHHNWQIAKKSAGETALAIVEEIIWQPSKSGRITPVILIGNTFLDGCNIKRITAHHAKHLHTHGIGKGAQIEISRSGSVIPCFNRTLKPVVVDLPTNCPSCDHTLVWDGVYLVCNGSQCSAQSATSVEFHFKTINADLFGPKTSQKLVDAGHVDVEKIYHLTEQDYIDAGFGNGQARNIVKELARVKSEPLRDYLLLGSLGIKSLGRGTSKKLLERYYLSEVLELTEDQLLDIEGFGELTSKSIVADLQASRAKLNFLLEYGFNLTHTKQAKVANLQGPLVGLHVVFTGTLSGNRKEMQDQASSLGAICQSSINKKSNLLICGSAVGESKMNKAKKLNVRILSEQEYLSEFTS